MTDQKKALQLVLGIADKRAAPKRRPRDVRSDLWDAAKAHASPGAPARDLMKLACWLYYTRKVAPEVICRALGVIGRARNPWAYLQCGGKAIEAVVASVAVERALQDKEANTRADAAFFGKTSRPRPGA